MTNEEETTMDEEVKDPQAVLAELRRAQDDLKTIRAELETATSQLNTLREEAKNDEWRGRALVAEIKSALTGQGIKDVDRVMKYVQTDGLDFDEEGKLTGLDDKLKEWQTDLPEVFDAKRRAGGKADAFANQTVEPKEDPMREAVRTALHGG